MTSETRTLIEPTDISAVEFECTHCKVKILYPLGGIDRLSDKCPNCYQSWFAAKSALAHPSERQPVDQVKAAIVGIQTLFPNLGILAKIRLEITPKISN
jgi:hypothetical protein